MTPEIIAIVTVGVALAGVILTSARGVRQDISELRGEVGDTPRTHGAPGRADGRIARSDHPPGQSQLTMLCAPSASATAWLLRGRC